MSPNSIYFPDFFHSLFRFTHSNMDKSCYPFAEGVTFCLFIVSKIPAVLDFFFLSVDLIFPTQIRKPNNSFV